MTKLPNLYTNSFDKKIDNSQDYTIIKKEEQESVPNKYELLNKIDNIFKSKNYIYKVKVQITLKNKTINETIIGKTKNNIITLDNKLININNIIDIKKID